jgi:hypothetical protein
MAYKPLSALENDKARYLLEKVALVKTVAKINAAVVNSLVSWPVANAIPQAVSGINESLLNNTNERAIIIVYSLQKSCENIVIFFLEGRFKQLIFN